MGESCRGFYDVYKITPIKSPPIFSLFVWGLAAFAGFASSRFAATPKIIVSFLALFLKILYDLERIENPPSCRSWQQFVWLIEGFNSCFRK